MVLLNLFRQHYVFAYDLRTISIALVFTSNMVPWFLHVHQPAEAKTTLQANVLNLKSDLASRKLQISLWGRKTKRIGPQQIELQLKSANFFGESLGTGPIGFVSKFHVILWYLCVRNSDMDPDRTQIDFGTPIPKTSLRKYVRILLSVYDARSHYS